MVTLQAFGNLWSLISNSGFVAQLVLLVLLGFSILSWAITYRKFRLFREARKQSQAFHSRFRSGSSLSAIQDDCEHFPSSPLAGLFRAAYFELQQEMEARAEASQVHNWNGIERAMQRAAQIEMTALEQGQDGQLFCKLQQHEPFEGPAEVSLLGLPAKVTTTPQQITKDDQELVFELKIDKALEVRRRRAGRGNGPLRGHRGTTMEPPFPARGSTPRV